METRLLVQLWDRARARDEEVYLATVVHVQGSAYRKAGARMLVTSGGERAGTISGGCLEAEVSRKIAWLTQGGTCLRRYQSSFDDDNEGVPYGLGCGGTQWILMQAGEAAAATMSALRGTLERRARYVVVCALQDARHEAFVSTYAELEQMPPAAFADFSVEQMTRALTDGRAVPAPPGDSSGLPRSICLPLLPPPQLHVFGAGDDAMPIVRFAAELGWDVTVADGRSQMLRRERFPQAKQLTPVKFSDSYSPADLGELIGMPGVSEGDCAVILTHSFQQDRALLRALLPEPLGYLGILGPLHRTMRLLDSITADLGMSHSECLARLHAPVGLSIGSGDPAVIALSIVAEIQAHLSGASATSVFEAFATESVPVADPVFS